MPLAVWKRGFSCLPILSLLVLLSLTGCWKRSGEAVVIAKDFVPALKMSETPAASPAFTAAEDASTPSGRTEDEEDADYNVGAPAVDPRATDHDVWIVTVRMIADGKRVDVRVDPPRWEALKLDDRVQVTYHQGKYTGTVWSAEIK